MSIKLKGSTDGSVTLQAPADTSPTGTDITLTLPDDGGTANYALTTNGSGGLSWFNGGPTFAAYSTTSTSLSANVETKIIFDDETFDTGSCFDSTTNYRFTPNVAGYYQVNGQVTVGGAGGAYTLCSLFKNTALYVRSNTLRTSNGNYNTSNVSSIVYLNGTTDYVELYAIDPSANSTITGTAGSYFSAAFIRPA